MRTLRLALPSVRVWSGERWIRCKLGPKRHRSHIQTAILTSVRNYGGLWGSHLLQSRDSRMRKTQEAFSYVMASRSLLCSCDSQWKRYINLDILAQLRWFCGCLIITNLKSIMDLHTQIYCVSQGWLVATFVCYTKDTQNYCHALFP